MSLDVDGEVRAMVRPSVPNYALRRCLVATTMIVALVFALTSAVGAMAALSGGTASAAPAGDATEMSAPSVHVARAGDTMWAIANTYRGEVDRDRYIAALIVVNGGVDVQSGAAILLP